jgi:hypothetical protein
MAPPSRPPREPGWLSSCEWQPGCVAEESAGSVCPWTFRDLYAGVPKRSIPERGTHGRRMTGAMFPMASGAIDQSGIFLNRFSAMGECTIQAAISPQ